MSSLRILTVAAVLAAPLAAAAADLPARYTADEKAIKAAIAGTNLTFKLYSDALCASLVSTTVIAIENVDLIARIKPFNPKNAVKKKNTVELRATLTGVPPTPSLYLQVTGTGVTPVGGACQSQASGLSGPSGSSPLLVKDSNAATVGVFDGAGSAIYDDGGTLVKLPNLNMAGFQQTFFFSVQYTSNNCTGTALAGVDNSLVPFANVVGTTAYYPPSSGAPTGINSALGRSGVTPFVNQAACDAFYGVGNSTFVAPDGCCQVTAFSFPAGPVITIDLSAFVPPFSVQ
jgi:hypothetical protein